MTWLLVKLGIRFVAFAGVLFFATYKNPKLKVEPKYSLPLVGLVFALLNATIYGLLAPILRLASLGTLWLVVPLIVNSLLLYATYRLTKKLRVKVQVDGVMPWVKLALLLTAVHGVLWLALEAFV